MPLLGGGRLPLAFIASGLGWWLVATAALLAAPTIVLQPHIHPWVVALAHLWLPGFLLSVCLGALYQLMPVILGVPLRAGERWIWLHLALHLAGVMTLVVAFATGRFNWAAFGGSVISLGIALLVVVTWRTFRASTRRDAIGWCCPLAVTWLGATVGSGVLLAVNRHAPFLPVSVLDLLRAHAHLGLAGFFLTLLQGVTFQLVPMFTLGQASRPRCVAGGLAAAQAGLVTLTTGFAGGGRAATGLGVLLLASGVGLSGIAFVATLRTRRRLVLEPGLRAFVSGAALLAVAGIVGGAVRFLPLQSERAMQLGAGYGLLVIAGALSLMILGMLCKIVPFLVWMRAYGPRVGRQPVPVATTLASHALERGWLGGHAAGLALLFAAILMGQPLLAVAGSISLAAGALCFVTNVGRVVHHLWSPRAPAPATSPSLP